MCLNKKTYEHPCMYWLHDESCCVRLIYHSERRYLCCMDGCAVYKPILLMYRCTSEWYVVVTLPQDTRGLWQHPALSGASFVPLLYICIQHSFYCCLLDCQ